MFEVNLTSRTEGPPVAFLRELTGADEMLASRRDADIATRLLERVLIDSPAAALGSKDAWTMCVSDRDRLIAGLYAHTFEDLVESRIACGSCGKAFGLSFSLAALMDQVDSDARAAREELRVAGPDVDGTYWLADGTHFRLPTPEDERQVARVAEEARAEALFRRCCLNDSADAPCLPERREALERALGALAPLLSLAVPTECVLCGAPQEVDFDIVRYFLSALSRERVLLTREIHTLARAYHWSFEEITRLPRSERHAHVELVELERGTLEAVE